MPKNSLKPKRFSDKQLESFTDKFWDELYRDFLVQDMGKDEFLRARGVPVKHRITREKTRAWLKDLRKSGANLRFISGTYISLGPSREVAQILELVKQWKNDLSVNHYKAAALCLAHAELQLTQGLETDDAGRPVKTKLSSKQIKDLTAIVGEVQKIQRTALGLPGETTGVITADVTEKDSARPDFVFNVKVNDNGKFVNPRPQLEDDREEDDDEELERVTGSS